MFGPIKNNLDNILVNTFTKKSVFKNAFHSLMSALKENKQSREFFVLYSQLENKNFTDKGLAETYLNQVVKTLKDKRKNLNTKKLTTTVNKFNSYINESTNKVYKDLDLLIFNENVTKIENVISGKKNLLTYLTRKPTIKISETNIPNSLLINIGTRKFNEKFKGLSESDKKKFKELYVTKTTDLKEEYDKNIKEVSDKLDSLIEETSDNTLLTKLKESKNKIDAGTFTRPSLFKIKEFKKTLLG